MIAIKNIGHVDLGGGLKSNIHYFAFLFLFLLLLINIIINTISTIIIMIIRYKVNAILFGLLICAIILWLVSIIFLPWGML